MIGVIRRMKSSKCKGQPSATQYGNGCRCALCRDAWRMHSIELRQKERKKSGGTKRDTPVVEHDAFTREQILAARASN